LSIYRERRDWDAAFELIVRAGLPEELSDLMSLALDELLDTARLSTLERWCDFAFDAELDAPLFLVARAEVLLRRGRHLEAIAHAESAAHVGKGYVFRALAIAGRAAHLASREQQALDLFRRAQAASCDDSERSEALWGQLLALIDLEHDQAEQTFRALRLTVRHEEPREFVRASAFALCYQIKLGDLDVAEADIARAVVSRVRDPLVISSFQSTYASALGLLARYGDALAIAEDLTRTIDRYRLDFATPYARLSTAVALCGLRRWAEAIEAANRGIAAAIHGQDEYAHQLCTAMKIRIAAQQGRYDEALDFEMPAARASLPAADAELKSSRALLLAAAGRVQDARGLIANVRGMSRAIEPAVLISAVDAVCAIRARDRNSADRVIQLEETAFERGGLDLLVTAYRSTPELLNFLLRVSPRRDRLVGLIRRVGDEDLAAIVGQPVLPSSDPRHALSRREREVYELLVQGLMNREIAGLLFIEESTVKAHVHHIYDKLGLRSRVALAVQAALERSSQATSAIDETSDDEGSSDA
jgi:DNA-binding NarL/FixJ family response regulator